MPKENMLIQENTILREVVEDFSLSSGMNTFLIDRKGVPDQDYAHYCPLAGKRLPECKECFQAMRCGYERARCLGGKFNFFCPKGLGFVISPIILRDKLECSIAAGPFVMSMETIERYCQDYTQEVPVIIPKRVFALSKCLSYHIACNFENKPDNYLKRGNVSGSFLTDFKFLLTNQKRLTVFLRSKVKEYMSYIEKGEQAKAESAVWETLDWLYVSCDRDFLMFRLHLMDYLLFLCHIASKNNTAPEQIFGVNYSSLEELDEIDGISQLNEWVAVILRRFFDCVFLQTQDKHANTIYKAIEYVHKNYNQKVYLEEVAAKIYLNPSYFSRVFKEKTGVTFHTYLTNYRIEMSKKHLMDLSIPILSVAALVGFDDQSYFTKVFKRKMGVTPKAFRSLI